VEPSLKSLETGRVLKIEEGLRKKSREGACKKASAPKATGSGSGRLDRAKRSKKGGGRGGQVGSVINALLRNCKDYGRSAVGP